MYDWNIKVEKQKSIFPSNAKNNQFYWHINDALFLRTSPLNIWSPIGIYYLSSEEKAALKLFLDKEYPMYLDPSLNKGELAAELKSLLAKKINSQALEKFCNFVSKADPTEVIRTGQRV